MSFALTHLIGFGASQPITAITNQNFNIVTWAGTGASQSVTGVGFQPDCVWIKRYDGVENWAEYNSGRGAQSKWALNTTTAHSTDTNGLTAFGSDGFTVGTSHSASGANYIAFCWKKGSAQFDHVQYTGNGTNSRLVSHSLGVMPGLQISKDTAGAFDSGVNGIGGFTTTGYFLNAGTANPGMFNAGTSTSSTQFNPAITAYNNNNASTTCQDWLWGSLASYSSIGSYTGNGSSTGPTVTTNFAPRFVMIKLVGSGGYFIANKVRSPTNTVTTSLQLNSTRAENTTDISIDLNSDGFQIKSATLLNTNASTYFYIAIA